MLQIACEYISSKWKLFCMSFIMSRKTQAWEVILNSWGRWISSIWTWCSGASTLSLSTHSWYTPGSCLIEWIRWMTTFVAYVQSNNFFYATKSLKINTLAVTYSITNIKRIVSLKCHTCKLFYKHTLMKMVLLMNVNRYIKRVWRHW